MKNLLSKPLEAAKNILTDVGKLEDCKLGLEFGAAAFGIWRAATAILDRKGEGGFNWKNKKN